MDKKHKSVPVDFAVAMARGGTARAFCDAYDLPKMRSFSIRLYGEGNSLQLASEVQRRLSYYYNLWFNGDDDFCFDNDMIKNYPEDEEWVRWACSLSLGPCVAVCMSGQVSKTRPLKR